MLHEEVAKHGTRNRGRYQVAQCLRNRGRYQVAQS